jgi:uncharacterized protein (TIRG00374 family)
VVAIARSADVGGALPIITAAGPAIALALVPYLAQLAFDALAWRTLLAGLGHRVAWRKLLGVRLATEAVLLSMPGGSLVGESLKPYLVGRVAPVPPSHAIASIGIKRSLLALAQALYLVLALVFGGSALVAASEHILGNGSLPYLVAGAAVFLFLAAGALALAFLHGRIAERVRRSLARLPSRRLRAWLDAQHAGFAETDAAFQRIGGRRRRLAAATALLLAAWVVETGETYVLLRQVGVDLPIASVLAMEASVVFVRNAAFFLPAGLGVQDAGYLAFLAAYGAPAAPAAAFAIVKRCKELVWVVVGYALLFTLDRRPTLVALGGLRCP